jgi:hypothetical protein
VGLGGGFVDPFGRRLSHHVLELLRRHVPAEILREIEEFVCYKFACDCFREAAERDLTRTELRETLPAERWGEIEQLVDSQVPKARSIHDAIFTWGTNPAEMD